VHGGALHSVFFSLLPSSLPTNINKIKLHMYSVWHNYMLHYTKIEIPNTSPASTFTRHNTVKLKIKDEIKLLFNETNRRTTFQIYSGTKLYMFRVVPLPIIRSYPLYIRHWHMLCRFDDSLRAGSGWNCSSILILHASCITRASAECTVGNSWWWADELPETCRISYQNKFGN
jgi:hypothetical protein